jgi:deazaflavin-dependent oxidoreductase (nitroreductase family)
VDAAARDAYVTTTGRRTGRPHQIEIWFATDGTTVWLLSGGGERSDWVQNLLARREANVRIGDEEFTASARLPLPQDEEKRTASRLLADKYPGYFQHAFADGYIIALDPAGQ